MREIFQPLTQGAFTAAETRIYKVLQPVPEGLKKYNEDKNKSADQEAVIWHGGTIKDADRGNEQSITKKDNSGEYAIHHPTADNFIRTQKFKAQNGIANDNREYDDRQEQEWGKLR